MLSSALSTINPLFLIGGLALLLLVATLLKVLLRNGSRPKTPRYAPVTHLFTRAEQSFHGVLLGVVGPDVTVHGKVRLADVILPESGGDKSAWWSAFNKVASKHIDFVVCDTATSRLLCCVELDDASHGRTERRSRDQFLEEVLGQGGVPLLRVPAQRSYVPGKVREAYLEVVGRRN